MSQRTALVLSLFLTVLVGVAIAANRDRLIGASPDTTSSGAVATVSSDTSGTNTDVAAKTGAQVVEVTLPASAAAAIQAGRSGGDVDARFEDDDHFDGEDGDDSRDEHDDSNDDDDEHGEEDDD